MRTFAHYIYSCFSAALRCPPKRDDMKKTRYALLPLLLAAIAMLTAACDSDSTYEVTSSRDCIVTSASLGTFYRMVNAKTNAGKDTTYRAAITGSYYPLSIDHHGQRIFNADSLPVGTLVDRTIFSEFNATGALLIRSLATGEDSIFSRTDSIDCSVERFVTVYATDGVSRRTYSLRLNVHREEADSFVWRKVEAGGALPASLAQDSVRLVSRAADRALLLYGTHEGRNVVAERKDDAWTRHEPALAPDPLSVVADAAGRFYGITSDGPAVSTDGMEWTPVAPAGSVDRLVVAGRSMLVGMKDGAFVRSVDGGATWTAEPADEPQHLPVADVRGCVLKSLYDNDIEEYIVTGRDAAGATAVWRRTVDKSAAAGDGWYYLPPVDDQSFHCPALAEPQLFTYDGVTCLVGRQQDGGVPVLYVSRDNGRTWAVGEFPFPVEEAARVAVAADADNFLWVVDGKAGDLWRGRYNRLGWQQPPMAFE